MLAETAALTTADETADVHLGRRLCEWEVRGAQTDFRISSEHLLGK